MVHKLKSSLRGAFVLGFALTLHAAYAGTFVYLAINSQSTHGNTNTLPGSTSSYSATTNVSSTLPYASMTADCIGGSSWTGPGNTAGGSNVFQRSAFEIQWKQDYVGEPTPSVLYHHHKYNYSLSSSKALTYGYSAKILAAGGSVGFADSTQVSANVGGLGGTNPPNSASANGSKLLSFSWIVANVHPWEYVSTDSVGRITYRTISPDIDSATAARQSQVYLTQVGFSGMSNSASAVADNFYFSTSSVTNYTNP